MSTAWTNLFNKKRLGAKKQFFFSCLLMGNAYLSVDAEKKPQKGGSFQTEGRFASLQNKMNVYCLMNECNEPSVSFFHGVFILLCIQGPLLQTSWI